MFFTKVLLWIWALWTLVVIGAIRSGKTDRQVRESLKGKMFEGSESILEYIKYSTLIPGVYICKFLYWQPFKKKD